jgi:DNA-binding transcriptional ArsR family regulator
MPAEATLELLSDATRRTVVQMLAERPHQAGELASAAGVSRPAMSRHLRLLSERGMVEHERPGEDGRGRLYRLRPEPLAELQDWLAGLSRMWQGELEAFARLAHQEAARGSD